MIQVSERVAVAFGLVAEPVEVSQLVGQTALRTTELNAVGCCLLKRAVAFLDLEDSVSTLPERLLYTTVYVYACGGCFSQLCVYRYKLLLDKSQLYCLVLLALLRFRTAACVLPTVCTLV